MSYCQIPVPTAEGRVAGSVHGCTEGAPCFFSVSAFLLSAQRACKAIIKMLLFCMNYGTWESWGKK